MRVSVCLKLRCYLNKTSMEVFRPAAVCGMMECYRWFVDRSEDGTPGRWNKRYTRYAAINHCRNYYEIYIQIDSMYQCERKYKAVCTGFKKADRIFALKCLTSHKIFCFIWSNSDSINNRINNEKNCSGLFQWHHWNPAPSLSLCVLSRWHPPDRFTIWLKSL